MFGFIVFIDVFNLSGFNWKNSFADLCDLLKRFVTYRFFVRILVRACMFVEFIVSKNLLLQTPFHSHHLWSYEKEGSLINTH